MVLGLGGVLGVCFGWLFLGCCFGWVFWVLSFVWGFCGFGVGCLRCGGWVGCICELCLLVLWLWFWVIWVGVYVSFVRVICVGGFGLFGLVWGFCGFPFWGL